MDDSLFWSGRLVDDEPRCPSPAEVAAERSAMLDALVLAVAEASA